MATNCPVCGNKLGIFKVKIKDGAVCGPCANRLPQVYYNIKEKLDIGQIKAIVRAADEYDDSRPDMIQQALLKFMKANPKSEDKFEEVRRYRELADDGIITEDEFEAKKKELLGL